MKTCREIRHPRHARKDLAVHYYAGAVSFHYHLEKDLQRVSSLGSLFIFPYLRVSPMLAIILAGQEWGVSSVAGMILFVALKTGADLLMHGVEHARTGRQPEQEV